MPLAFTQEDFLVQVELSVITLGLDIFSHCFGTDMETFINLVF